MKSEKFIIVGAGMAGLLAGNMLRSNTYKILEALPELPNNHHALLRFRTGLVGEVVGVPFKKVTVIKDIDRYRSTFLGDVLSYSYKATGKSTLRSVITAGTEYHERYISPPDLIERMYEAGPPIQFGLNYLPSSWDRPVISTIPMPNLMDMLNYPRPEHFEYRSGWVWSADLDLSSRGCLCDDLFSIAKDPPLSGIDHGV